MGSAPIQNALCQPKCGMKPHEASAAASQPSPQKLSRRTISRPRTAGGANSLTSETATGSWPPSPKPTQKRQNSRMGRLGERAHRPVAML